MVERVKARLYGLKQAIGAGCCEGFVSVTRNSGDGASGQRDLAPRWRAAVQVMPDLSH